MQSNRHTQPRFFTLTDAIVIAATLSLACKANMNQSPISDNSELDCGTTSSGLSYDECEIIDGVCVAPNPLVDRRVRADETFLQDFEVPRSEGSFAAIPCDDGVHYATLRTDGYAPLSDAGFPVPGRLDDHFETQHYVAFNVFHPDNEVAIATIDFRDATDLCPYIWNHSSAADTCVHNVLERLRPVWEQCQRDGDSSSSRCECYLNELPGREVIGCD